MSDFVLLPSKDYVAELLWLVPSFAASSKYRSLDQEDRLIAGLVFSAFSRFFEASYSNRVVADECIHAIEEFATNDDVDAHNLLITEVFEGLRHPEIAIDLLLPNSRALYDKWIGVR